MPQYHKLETREQIDHFLLEVAKRRATGQPTTVCFGEPDNHITQRQVNSLNLWCRQVAQAMAEAGLDMKHVIHCEIPPSEYLVKERIYKPMLEAMTGKQSTMDQTTTDPSAVADVIIRELGERLGITLPPWPDRFNRGQDDGRN